MGFNSAFKGLMYICCALVGAIKDSVSQNARCNSEKRHCSLMGALILSETITDHHCPGHGHAN